jgi:hypothetical protein
MIQGALIAGRGDFMSNALRALRIVALVGGMLAPTLAFGQESKSAALATELVRLLDQMKLDSIAAHGADGQQFIGALYFPGSQLLVVSAKFSVPERLSVLLGQKAYKDIYIDLNSASVRESKVFISDLGANGLRFKRENNQPYDTVDVGGKTVAFDGDWRKAKISQQEYTKTFQTADEQYVQMLQALVAELKKTS